MSVTSTNRLPHPDFIHHSFKTAGFLVDEDRPLMVCSFTLLLLFNPCLFASAVGVLRVSLLS